MNNSELSPVLNLIMKDLADEFSVSDEEYRRRFIWYDKLPDYEKLERLLGAVSQYLTSPSAGSAAIMASAIVCTHRYIEEKSLEDF